LWHNRMRHISSQGLVKLNKKDVFKGLKTVENEFCEHCVFGKSHRVRFAKGTHTTRGILDYVHTDLWGL
jgi:hypothetical protein